MLDRFEFFTKNPTFLQIIDTGNQWLEEFSRFEARMQVHLDRLGRRVDILIKNVIPFMV